MDRGAIIVVDSRETLDKITESYMALENRENLYLYTYNRAQADLKGDKEDRIAFIEEYREAMKEAYGLNNSTFTVLSYDLDRIEWNELYGGFLFLGVALGLLFLMAMDIQFLASTVRFKWIITKVSAFSARLKMPLFVMLS